MTTRERVEQIRRQMQTRMPSGSRIIIKTHKNAIACELLEFIDANLLPTDAEQRAADLAANRTI